MSENTHSNLGLERTRLARDRTFVAVVRTVLAFVGFGIGVAKLLPDLQPAWLVQALGILLIAGGGITALLGFRTTHAAITRLREDGIKEPRWFVTTIQLLLLATAIMALLVVGFF